MSKQLTPMQEAIDFIEKEIRAIEYTSDYDNGKDSAFMTCLYKLEELLPKEQQVIDKKYIQGAKDYCKSSDGIDTFITKFKQNGK